MMPQENVSRVGLISPDPTQASHFYIYLNIAEIIVAFGQSRLVFNGEEHPPCHTVIEWLKSVMLSPVTAKDLVRVLGKAVSDYEAQFGPIPDVPELSEPKNIPESPDQESELS